MSVMGTWNENDVNRDRAGRFDEKPQSAAEARLPQAGAAPGSEATSEVSLGATEEPQPVTQDYHMRRSRLGEAQHRIELANRRLERAGIEERFETEVEEYIHDDGQGHATQMVKLTLNRPSISYGGWVFTAAHDATPDGRVISFGAAKATDMHCDHCGHNRRRGRVYTVTNPETGETAQVGGNCMADFLGVKPQGLWALTDDPLEGEEEDPDVGGFARGVDDVFPAAGLVAGVLAASGDGQSFRSRGQATMKDPATVDVFLEDADSFLGMEHPPERLAMARDILTWVNAQPDGESDYIDNLRGVLAGDERWVGRKHAAIAASVVSAYRRAQERETERKTREEAPYTPGFLGEVKERVRDVPVTVEKAIYLGESSFGYHPQERWLVIMRTADGKTAKWFATGSQHGHYEPGQKLTMTATVKAHDQYESKDQTLVTRAVLTPVEG